MIINKQHGLLCILKKKKRNTNTKWLNWSYTISRTKQNKPPSNKQNKEIINKYDLKGSRKPESKSENLSLFEMS